MSEEPESKYNAKNTVMLSALTAMICFAPATVQAACVSSLISVTLVTTPLDFATLAACSNASGVARFQSTGAFVTEGCIDLQAGVASPAYVRVKANQSKANDKVLVQIPATVTLTNGTTTMKITQMYIDRVNSGTTNTVKGNQTKTWDYSGRLQIDANQPGGTYTGTFTVSATCL